MESMLLFWEDTRFERLYLNSAERSSSVLGLSCFSKETGEIKGLSWDNSLTEKYFLLDRLVNLRLKSPFLKSSMFAGWMVQ